MLRKSFVFTVVAAFMLVLFSGCQKDDDNDEPSGQEILTSGQWKITAAVANPPITVPGIGAVTDVYTLLAPLCFKDNYYVFNANGTAETNEGATKCVASDPQSSPGTWSLSADEKVLTLNGNAFTVLELTANQMRLNGSLPVQGISVTGDVTFTK